MSETAFDVKQQLVTAFRDLIESVILGLPKLLVGLVLLVVAFLVAKAIQKVLALVLRKLRFDAVLERIGLKKALARLGVVQSADVLIPKLLYVLILVLFAQTAADVLGLAPISGAIASFFSYLPNLVAALLVVLLGSVAGSFVGDAVARAAGGAGIDYAKALGSAVSGMILLIAGIMAVGQLQIETEIIRIVTLCLLAGLALAFGLSFGLGSRGVTRNILAGFYVRRMLSAGDRLRIGGHDGALREITPVQTVIETEQGRVAIANETLLAELRVLSRDTVA